MGAAQLAGRRAELAVIEHAVTSVLAGRPTVVWIEGEGGIGKTTLVRAALERLPPGFSVIRGEAEERDRHELWFLADRLGRHDATTPLAVAMELLEAWTRPRGPVVVVAEDLHFADPESRLALLSAARRLGAEPVLLLVTSRPRASDDGWERLRLDPESCTLISMPSLSATEVGEMAAEEGIKLGSAAARRLAEHTKGHPLYVRTLLHELSSERLMAATGSLPAPRSLSLTTVRRLSELSPPARRLAGALAVLNQRGPLAVAARVGGVAGATEALEELLSTGFVDWEDSDVAPAIGYIHPLYRAAVYDDLGPLDRRSLHLAAASALGGGAALTHRVAAADGSDEALARALHEAARAEANEGRLAVAVRYLLWASDLSEEPWLAESRLLRAARLLSELGQLPELGMLQRRLEACRPSPMRAYVLGLLAWDGRSWPEAEALFAQAAHWGELDPHDPDLELQQHAVAGALAQLSAVYLITIRPALAAKAAEAVFSRPAPPDVVRRALGTAAAAEALFGGPASGLARLARNFTSTTLMAKPDEAVLLIMRGYISHLGGWSQAAGSDLRRALRLIGPRNAMRDLLRGHVYLAQALEESGEWDEAIVKARVALSLMSDESGTMLEATAHAALVGPLGARGKSVEAQVQLDAARRATEVSRTVANELATRCAAALFHRAEGRWELVVEQLLPLSGLAPAGTEPFSESFLHLRDHGVMVRWWPWLIEALCESGRRQLADDQLQQYVLVSSVQGLDHRARIAAASALLHATAGEAEPAKAFYREAWACLRPDEPPLEQARLYQAFGRFLVSQGERREGVDHLRAAHRIFGGLGASAYLGPVESDLQEAGITAAPTSSPFSLTEREHDVATLLAKGLTKSEAAAELFVSSSTVDYHLRNVYAKLGIRSRRELRDRLAVRA